MLDGGESITPSHAIKKGGKLGRLPFPLYPWTSMRSPRRKAPTTHAPWISGFWWWVKPFLLNSSGGRNHWKLQKHWLFILLLQSLCRRRVNIMSSPHALPRKLAFRLLFIWWNWMMPSILATLVCGVWYSYRVWEKLTTSHTLPETQKLIRDDHLTCSAYSRHSAASSPWPSHPNFSSSFLLLSALNWFVQGKIHLHLIYKSNIYIYIHLIGLFI